MKFVDETIFLTMTCGGCHIKFAVSEEFYKRRLDDKKRWYCPNGCSRVFNSKSKEQKLKERLETEQRKVAQAQIDAQFANNKTKQITKSYQKMRDRVKNGVCPCCNRTFQNLLNHIKTKHPEFGNNKALKTVRLNFGLTQCNLADEIGVSSAYISNYENERYIPEDAKETINEWLAEQGN